MAWILAALLVSAQLPTQTPAPDVQVSGRVVAGADKHAVAGAVVSSGAARATADENGGFALRLPAGQAQIDVTATGFTPQRVSVAIASGMPALEILLVEQPDVREEVTVSAAAGVIDDAVRTRLVPNTVQRVAGAADNIFRVLQTLPGVNAADDFGSRLVVRGGGPDQNLTVMDGIEIHNPYRLFGFASAFNPETVDHFELTAGGFGAPYGDRLSSLLVVDNRPGTTKEAIAGSANISITDMNIVVEGKLPGDSKGSWIVTGRRSYYDLVAERIVHTDLPRFADLQLKTVWAPKPGHTLTLFGLRSRERTDLTFDNEGFHLGDRSRNDLAALTCDTRIAGRIASRTIASWSQYTDSLDIQARGENSAERSNSPGDSAFSQVAIVFTRDLTVYDRSLRQEFRWSSGERQTFEAGADVHALRTLWGWRIGGDRNDGVANGSSVLGGASLPSFLRSRHDSTRAAAWVQDRIQLTPRLRLAPGLRIDRSGLGGETIASPRASVRFDVTARTALIGATGRYTQSPGYEKLLQADYFVELTDGALKQLRSERSIHAIGGIEHRFTSGFLGRVETYYKHFDRLVVGRLETPEETAARVAQYNFPGPFASSVPSGAMVTTQPVNGASGRAYGFETYVERTSQVARLTGWASYGWGRSNLDSYGQHYPFDYDRRHAVSLVGTYGLRPRIDFGATWRIASGFARTKPVGVRVASRLAPGALPDTPGSLIPSIDFGGTPIWTLDYGDVSNTNRSRLPVYSRLDVRVTFKPKSPAGRWIFYIEILNLLNRKNVSAFDPQLAFDPNSDRPAIEYANDSGLPRLPSFGVRFRF